MNSPRRKREQRDLTGVTLASVSRNKDISDENVSCTTVEEKLNVDPQGDSSTSWHINERLSNSVKSKTYNGGQKSLERSWKTFLPHPQLIKYSDVA